MLLNTTVPGAATASFAPQQGFGTYGAPNSVTAADVNGDGKPDLILASVPFDTMSVLLNFTPYPGASAAVRQSLQHR